MRQAQRCVGALARWGSVAGLCAAVLVSPGPGAAQGTEIWKLDTALGLHAAAAECLGAGYPRAALFLGVDAAGGLLVPSERAEVAQAVTTFFETGGGLRVRAVPGAGSGIGAGSGNGSGNGTGAGLNTGDRAALAALLAEHGGGLGFALVPIERVPEENVPADGDGGGAGPAQDSLAAEIRVWTDQGADGGLGCDQSFAISMPIAARDPSCQQNFDIATGAVTGGTNGGTQGTNTTTGEDAHLAALRLQSFVQFYPACPQVAQAKALLQELEAARREAERAAERAAACRAGFDQAETAGTAAALDAYLATGADCAEYSTALWLRDRRRADEICIAAYTQAAEVNTQDSFQTYLDQYGDCDQAVVAEDALRALQAAAPPPPDYATAAKEHILGVVAVFSSSNAEYLALTETLFADRVSYYGKSLSRAQVLRDKRNFVKRFPIRDYRVQTEYLEASCSEAAEPVCRVTGRVRFKAVKPSGRVSSGVASFDYLMVAAGDSFLITKETGDVISRD